MFFEIRQYSVLRPKWGYDGVCHRGGTATRKPTGGLERTITMVTNLNGSVRMFYSVTEVSQLFGISTKSVYRLLARGLLKSSSALRHKKIPLASIEEFMAKTVNNGGSR